MVLGATYCSYSKLSFTNPLLLTIDLKENDNGCALKGAMHPVHWNLKILKMWHFVFQLTILLPHLSISKYVRKFIFILHHSWVCNINQSSSFVITLTAFLWCVQNLICFIQFFFVVRYLTRKTLTYLIAFECW